jgi:4-amino-4-deoxy-L-arabinose transferase-like glycosyltransferase
LPAARQRGVIKQQRVSAALSKMSPGEGAPCYNSAPTVVRSTSTPILPAPSPPWLRLAAWAGLLWVVIAWRLGYLTLLDPDEAHYAAITREMLAAREWLVPLLEGAPFIDKPVLFHWLQAVTFRLFGESEISARLPSAGAALALIAVTFWLGRRLFGTEAGERAALMLAATPATFALSGLGVFDMLFTALLFGGLACLAIAGLDGRRGVETTGYLLLALAVLTKGPVALVLAGLTFLLALAMPATRAVALRLRWGRGLALILAVSLPWFLWMWWAFGEQFVERYLLYGNVWLFSRPLYRERFDAFFYARTFLFAFLPWSPLVLGRLVDILRARAAGVTPGEVFLWLWILVVVGFFSLSRFKLDTYIYPAAPAVCLLAADAWQRLRGPDAAAAAGARWSLAAVPLILIGLGAAAWAFLFELGLPVSRAAILLPIALIAGGLTFGMALVRRGWRPSRFGASLLATLVAVYAIVGAVGFPVLEASRPTPELARQLAPVLQPDDRVGLYHLSKWQASLRFYTNRPVAELRTAAEVHAFFVAPGRGYALMKEPDALQLMDRDPALRVVASRAAIVRSEGRGRGLRRQRWATVVVLTREAIDP